MRAQDAPEDISLVELGQTAKPSTSRGVTARTSYSRKAARDGVRKLESRELGSGSDEEESAKLTSSAKVSNTTCAKATTNLNAPIAVKGKKREKAKKSAVEVKTSKAESISDADAKATPHQVGNPSIGISEAASQSNLEPVLASKPKPIRQKRSLAKKINPVQSRKFHRAASGPDSLDSGLSMCPPPIPSSPKHCSLPHNFIQDPASLSSAPRLLECPVQQNSDTTYLSVSSLPSGHPHYFRLSSRRVHASLPFLKSPNNQHGQQLSSSPQFSLASMSPSYF